MLERWSARADRRSGLIQFLRVELCQRNWRGGYGAAGAALPATTTSSTTTNSTTTTSSTSTCATTGTSETLPRPACDRHDTPAGEGAVAEEALRRRSRAPRRVQ